MDNRYRLAIVVPRYGRDVNGGIETHAREFATRLTPFMDVTVLTTCARDYRTWEDHFPAGEWRDGEVVVHRFSVPHPRDEAKFDAHSALVLTGRLTGKRAEARWMELQGPISPDLESHLKEFGAEYDAVLFMPYLYATSARGLPLVSERAVLMTAMHDEPPLRLGIFDDLIAQAPSLIMNTEEELALAIDRFGIDPARAHIVGAGVDPPAASDRHAFAERSGVVGPYVAYVGRIDPSKGMDVLFDAHRLYRQRNPEGADLVLVGGSVMDIPDDPWIYATGFVSDDEKHEVLAGCTALATASPYESLSLVLLEAWSHGRPVIVSEDSPVLVGRVRKAGGGLWFSSAEEYAACLELLVSREPIAWSLGQAGRRFASGFTWEEVIQKLIDALPGARVRTGVSD